MEGRTVYLCAGLRSPIGRYGGALAKVRADDLAAHPIKALMASLREGDVLLTLGAGSVESVGARVLERLEEGTHA